MQFFPTTGPTRNLPPTTFATRSLRRRPKNSACSTFGLSSIIFITTRHTQPRATAVWVSEKRLFATSSTQPEIPLAGPGSAIHAFPAVDKATFEDVGGPEQVRSWCGFIRSYSVGRLIFDTGRLRNERRGKMLRGDIGDARV